MRPSPLTVLAGALAIGFALACGSETTLDPEDELSDVDLTECCCKLTEGEHDFYDGLATDVCTSQGGECVDEARCEAFAEEPCCCVRTEGGENVYEMATWGTCNEPAHCMHGECPEYEAEEVEEAKEKVESRKPLPGGIKAPPGGGTKLKRPGIRR